MNQSATGSALATPHQGDSLLEPEALVTQSLGDLVRALYRTHFGGRLPDQPLDLNLSLTVDPKDGWDASFKTSLQTQIIAALEQVEAVRDVYEDGAVHCFRCETATCEHARPSAPLEVFDGYNQVGTPQWLELTQFLLNRGDERVGELFGDRPRLLTIPIRGRDLRARQLSQFGRASKTYSLLYQVVVGYLSRPSRLDRERLDRLALSYQAVEVRDAAGRIKVVLNRIGVMPEGWDDAFMERWFPWVARAESRTRDALKQLVEKLQAPDADSNRLLGRVPEILRKLGNDIAQGRRQAQRQTNHARERKQIRRPVDMALADLAKVRPDQMYRDLRTNAVVITAGKGRCHVFNEGGRHVTSFTIQPSAVEGRLRKERWARLEEAARERFLDQFAQS